ncbi:MAG: YitT family protein [Bacteroidales bacterium]|nr:YitT family protein [Bacteroidales bacterium]
MMGKLSQGIAAVKTAKFWKELIIMTLGMAVTAASVYYFLVPSQLIIGTTSGLAIVLCQVLGAAGLPVSLSVMITFINVLLLVLAYFLVDKEFGVKTVYASLVLGPLTDFWALVLPWEKLAVENPMTHIASVMGDPWLDLCCFVLLLSAAQAMLFQINASTGGLDILAKIVNKYMHFDMGAAVSITGAIICCTAFFINPFRMVVVGLIGTWINGLVIDYFTAMLNNRKRVCIVSKEHDRIRRFIIEKLHRGCTLYEVIGGYSNEKSIELQTLLSKDEFSSLMAFIRDNEINAFTTAGNVSEVYGQWFNNSHRRKVKRQIDTL